jgi:hypothetical protein
MDPRNLTVVRKLRIDNAMRGLSSEGRSFGPVRGA